MVHLTAGAGASGLLLSIGRWMSLYQVCGYMHAAGITTLVSLLHDPWALGGVRHG